MTANDSLCLLPRLFKVDGFEHVRHILCDNDSVQASNKPYRLVTRIGIINRLNQASIIHVVAGSSEILLIWS
jgi:hypothetical protein